MGGGGSAQHSQQQHGKQQHGTQQHGRHDMLHPILTCNYFCVIKTLSCLSVGWVALIWRVSTRLRITRIPPLGRIRISWRRRLLIHNRLLYNYSLWRRLLLLLPTRVRTKTWDQATGTESQATRVDAPVAITTVKR